ncbi:MAG: quinone-dependent dihydroorotate dehydrogenase, partial [Cyclobacteriaceae bacterium]|nr:quinone-dependent dihydroorotate dehydrogenase [Cyclobacteriaceae bacterium]
GGNIGKNKITPNEKAFEDYEICLEQLYDYVDYFVVNISSPNTPGLRELQEKEPLTKLLEHLKKQISLKEKPKPLLLKIAPDLTNDQLKDIVSIVKKVELEGIIATNTTIQRDSLVSEPEFVKIIGAGGLSGKPLTNRSTEVIRFLRAELGEEMPIIGVGGIHSAEEAIEKLDAGATLIQLYTGFIYEGPGLVKRINKALINKG